MRGDDKKRSGRGTSQSYWNNYLAKKTKPFPTSPSNRQQTLTQMVAFSLVFTILLSVASSTAFTATTTTQPIGRRTTAEVLDAISNVSTALTRLDDLVTAYPMTGGTITGAFVCRESLHHRHICLNSNLVSRTSITILQR